MPAASFISHQPKVRYSESAPAILAFGSSGTNIQYRSRYQSEASTVPSVWRGGAYTYVISSQHAGEGARHAHDTAPNIVEPGFEPGPTGVSVRLTSASHDVLPGAIVSSNIIRPRSVDYRPACTSSKNIVPPASPLSLYTTMRQLPSLSMSVRTHPALDHVRRRQTSCSHLPWP